MIEDLKKSAIAYQAWIDSGFMEADEVDETDIYPSDLFHAVATPKNILKLLDDLDELRGLRAERDALKARVDGGIRVTASKYPGNDFVIHAESQAVYGKNSILILDEGVEL